MFKRRKVEELTPQQIKRNELLQELTNCRRQLEENVIMAYCITESIKVYPIGADKEAAEKESIEAQQSVRNEIAWYDDLVCRYNKIRDDWVEYPNSHDVVTSAIRKFLGR